ncbi:hypothetical protein CUMW_239760 [Citrus unshiu]|uniref:Uncharacterized protein n=1 Tax=Citrus unshiu TaxID=55188 RepID=A0A2H5QKW0_CITUN|nr:hypothetical protein CUMW_239760 [Citrus unshiu]
MVYDSFDNALFEKDEKFKTTWLKNLDHNIEKYNLYGFTSGVQVFLNQLWNNEDCAVDSLVFDDCLNCYLCGRQHTMSKSMTDVDMPLEVIFPRWLEYVGFYNIHLSCGVPTLGKLSQLRARHNKSPELAIAVFLY